MKHLGNVTAVQPPAQKKTALSQPGFADAKTDFQNAIWYDFSNKSYAKVNEFGL